MSRIYEGTHDFTGATVVGVGGSGQTIYDAIVASGGGKDYTTLGAAITAGHKFILIMDGTTVEAGAITLPSYTHIVGESLNARVGMGTNLLTLGAYNTVENIMILSTLATDQIILGGDSTVVKGCWIWNMHTTNPGTREGTVTDNGVARGRIRFYDCQFVLCGAAVDMDNRTGIYQSATGSSDWKFIGCSFVGENSTIAILPMYFLGTRMLVSDCNFESLGDAARLMIYFGGDNCTASNISLKDSSCQFGIDGEHCVVSNFTAVNSTMFFNLTGAHNVISNCSGVMEVRTTVTGHHSYINNVITTTGMSILSDSCTISNCRAGADAGGGAVTITLASGADNNIVIGCRTDAAISDSGTGNVLTSNMVY